MNRRTVIAGLLALIVTTGCNGATTSTNDDATESNTTKMKQIDPRAVLTYCDREQNVEYLIYSDYRQSGMVLRVGSDGLPVWCE